MYTALKPCRLPLFTLKFAANYMKFMNKILSAILVAALLPFFAGAQVKDSNKGREKLIEEIRKEKIRTQPIKISDAIKAHETGEKKTPLKTTGGNSIEKKVSGVSSSGTEEGEAFIAINPNNEAQLVLSYMSQSPSLSFPVYYSNDSGNTWTKSSFNPLTGLGQNFPGGLVAGGGDPVFAYDKNGKLFMSWIYLVINQANDTVFETMYWASSLNNGQTWTYAPGNSRFIGISKIDPTTFEAFPGADGFYDRQWFAVDRSNGTFSGRLYSSFLYISTPTEDPLLSGTWIKGLDAGANSWNPRNRAYIGQSQFANVAVDNAGILHVTFADVGSNQVFHVSSSDGGQTFTLPHLIYTGTNLFGSQGAGTIHDRENSAVNLAIDGNNNLHLVWSDFDLFSSPYASFYGKSTDGGVTWSSPVDIGTLLPQGRNSLMPVVSAYGNKVTIGTYGVDNNTLSDYYNISSQTNGVSWDTARMLSTQTMNFSANNGVWFGDYFNSVRTSCKIYNIWSDGRGTSRSKMYVSVTNECNKLGIEDVTPVNATFSIKNIYPNPAEANLNLSINSTVANVFTISVQDITGKQLKTESRSVAAGETTFAINIADLAPGYYAVRVQSKDGFKYSRGVEKK
jgi:hypothetical protein